MDAVEEWLRERGKDRLGDSNMPKTRHDVCIDLATAWHDKPPVALVPYEGERNKALEDFLATIEGPAMIGFEPTIYPACPRCHQAWKLCRTKGTWAWTPDCMHRTAKCKLVKA